MTSKSSKPARCQHKPTMSCSLCRREYNELQQVGSWARDSNPKRTGSMDYASFIRDSTCLPTMLPSLTSMFLDQRAISIKWSSHKVSHTLRLTYPSQTPTLFAPQQPKPHLPNPNRNLNQRNPPNTPTTQRTTSTQTRNDPTKTTPPSPQPPTSQLHSPESPAQAAASQRLVRTAPKPTDQPHAQCWSTTPVKLHRLPQMQQWSLAAVCAP